MCGIAGYWQTVPRQSLEILTATTLSMCEALRQRGPDDGGTWSDSAAGITLGHRRLSILDLSPLGRQPMASVTGRFIVAFNGEIYNFQVVKKALLALGHIFRGGSDTEVMLAAFEEWGVVAAVRRFWGMFAFAVWDRDTRSLWLARDRIGVKPLYYGNVHGVVYFSSELKAIVKALGSRPRLSLEAVSLFLRHTFIPGGHCIYEGFKKLEAGHIAVFSGTHVDPKIECYWSAKEEYARAQANMFRGGEADAQGVFDDLIEDCVRLRMISDVPVGAFLSGGIDSSIITALMQRNSSRPVKTFTIGFRETGFDEANYAREAARLMGTEHSELYVSQDDALNIVPLLPEVYDEPFADSTAIPTCLVSKLASTKVKVALSGDGGDELFCGYSQYRQLNESWKWIRTLPANIRSLLSGSGRGLGEFLGGSSISGLRRVGGAVLGRTGNLSCSTPVELYRRRYSYWENSSKMCGCPGEPKYLLSGESREALPGSLMQILMLLDTAQYLPDCSMVKVDRASMSFGLEAREPLLDHRLFEFAWSLPISWSLMGAGGKAFMRKWLGKNVHPTLFERPKHGFSVPVAAWLRGPLKDWAEGLLDEGALRREGLLDVKTVRREWKAQLEGRTGLPNRIWIVLMLRAWMERWHDV